jgi:serine/threonine protein kinase/tetratricopeptide (TPR) repeat protein
MNEPLDCDHAPSVSVSDGPDAILDDLIEILTARLHAGERIDVDEVARRHPEYAKRLRRLVPALQMMAEFGDSSPREIEGIVASQTGPGAEVLGDFRIVREIGRGGMGVVYEAEQISLDRRVALKVLPMAAAMDSKQLQRFQLEAHAAACLHHTNIVPVYAVGCERGVPFYAMQYIDGRSLAQVLDELRRFERKGAAEPPAACAADIASSTLAATLGCGGKDGGNAGSGGPNATADHGDKCDNPEPALRAEGRTRDTAKTRPGGDLFSGSSTHGREYMRTVAQLGVQVAEALDHAHTRGILHRDIKPANLLLDNQGQLWVTDFGLAQIQGNPALTMTGAVLGTLRYMSPEQALAKRVVIDGRTDIYSLGVTLYEILTLRPAFDGRDRQETLRKIAETEPMPARKLNPAVDGDLETIVLKAMSKEPSGRYATARDLADELRRFLEHKPIRARRPSVLDRCKKWARRHRPAVATGAAGLLAAGLILAGSIGWIARDRAARRTMTQREVIRALDEAAALERQAKWPEALETAKLAEGLVAAGAGESLQKRVAALQEDVKMVLRLEQIWLRGVHGTEDDFRWADAAFGEAFREDGIDVEAIPASEAARRIRERTIHLELATALDSWADRRQAIQRLGLIWDGWPDQPDHSRARSDANWKRLVAVARLADPHEFRDQVRAALEREDRGTLARLAASPRFGDLPAQMLSVVSRHVDNEHITLALRRAQLEHPDNFAINRHLAWVSQTGEERIRFLTAALAARPDHAATAYWLGHQLRLQGRPGEAAAAYRKAIILDPDFVSSYTGLVQSLESQGKRDETRDEIRSALAAKADNAQLHNDIAWFLATCADARFREPLLAVELARRAVELAPVKGAYWNTLGVAHYRAGNSKAAIPALEKSLRLQGHNSWDWFFLAMARRQLCDRAEAGRLHEKAIRWMERFKPKDEELLRFRSEAAALMGSPEPRAPAASAPLPAKR